MELDWSTWSMVVVEMPGIYWQGGICLEWRAVVVVYLSLASPGAHCFVGQPVDFLGVLVAQPLTFSDIKFRGWFGHITCGCGMQVYSGL